ncbi:MAG: Hsp20/alpha crystallin family protein [Alkalispirochaeta sp.]
MSNAVERKNTTDVDTRQEGSGPAQRRKRRIFPAYEVYHDKKAVHLRVEMPGLEREDVDLTVDKNQLIISGTRPEWSVDGTVLLRERRVGEYYRAFTLDETVDPESISATMHNGVLEVTMGLRKQAQPRRIKIKNG